MLLLTVFPFPLLATICSFKKTILAHHLKALGKVEVKLDCRALPSSPDSVLDLDVDLGAIKCAAALIHLRHHKKQHISRWPRHENRLTHDMPLGYSNSPRPSSDRARQNKQTTCAAAHCRTRNMVLA